MREPILVGWSGGRDCTVSVHELQKSDAYDMTLFTTVTDSPEGIHVTMHRIRELLLDAQAASLGLPIEKVSIPAGCSIEEYGAAMRSALEPHIARGVRRMAFGDIFLDGIREYRTSNLAGVGMDAVFPIWGRDSNELAQTFIDLGFAAVIVSVDTELISPDFLGRTYDKTLLADLPDGADPCGERGEFHSFVFDGPIFDTRVDYALGQTTVQDGRYYHCDLLPREA